MTAGDVSTQIAYVAQRSNEHAVAVAHTVRRKTGFDREVQGKGLGKVVFRPGQSVQLYRRIAGLFNARRLHASTPREGTRLARGQAVVQERADKEEAGLLVSAGTAKVGGREYSDEEDVFVNCEEGSEVER